MISEPGGRLPIGEVAPLIPVAAPTAAMVEQACHRIAPHVWPTPLLHSHWLSELTGGQVYLKLEGRQRLGSFKVRGMVNRILAMDEAERASGIVVASSGNHGVAASWAGHRWGLQVEVFVPRTTPQAKLVKIQRYGARLRLVGDNYDQAYAAARHEANLAGGKVWIDSCSDPLAVAGHGTIGTEILAVLPDVDDILVPIGGGGLISGISTAVRSASPSVQITGVQTAACPAMLAAIQDQAFYEVYPAAPSLCEALIGGVGALGFQEHHRLIDRVVLTGEDSIGRAVVDLLQHEQVLAEPSGAVPCSYIMEQPAQFAGRRVVAVCSGQNIDFGLLQRLLATYAGAGGAPEDDGHAR